MASNLLNEVSSPRFGLDLFKQTLEETKIPFINPFQGTTQLGYNPHTQVIIFMYGPVLEDASKPFKCDKNLIYPKTNMQIFNNNNFAQSSWDLNALGLNWLGLNWLSLKLLRDTAQTWFRAVTTIKKKKMLCYTNLNKAKDITNLTHIIHQYYYETKLNYFTVSSFKSRSIRLC